MFASALFLSALTLCTAAQSAEPEGGQAARVRVFARELRVREGAADPSAACAWIDAALSRAVLAVPWTETADALEALARALDARAETDIERWRPALLKLTVDSHPNVRAGAWRVLAASPHAARPALQPSKGVLTWDERVERARNVARSGTESGELEALCADRDPRVAEVALAEWMQSPLRDEEPLARAWMRAFDGARQEVALERVRLFELLELAPRGRAVAERIVQLARARGGEAESLSLNSLCLACLARQEGKLSAADLDLLADGWAGTSRTEPGARALLVRAARSLGPDLGERLLARACSNATDVESASYCFAGAVEALEPARLLESVAPKLHEQPALAELLLDSLRGRVDAWDPQALTPWLAPSVAPSQRAHALLVVGETFRQNRDMGSATILASTLLDSDPSIAAEAFQSLAGAADPTPWMECLHAAWVRRPSAWQEARLADLSREFAWAPFRPELLELASKSRSASARVAELLAPFHADSEVMGALREWLEQDLARVRELPRAGPESEQTSAVISSALSLVRALVQVSGEAANPDLAEALQASQGRSLELGKACIFLLGRSESGRRGLCNWLSAETPSRLRAEAAFALAAFPGRAAAIRVLLDDYERYDEDLRIRALRAFAGAEDEQSALRLTYVAKNQASGAAELIAAVESLCARARHTPSLVDELFRWLDEPALDSELRTLIITELAKLKAADVNARLGTRLTQLELRRATDLPGSRQSEEHVLERETLITGLASADAQSALPGELAFEAPLERAATEFAARASGQHRAEVEFTWRAELSLVSAFARAGRLDNVLDATSGWRGSDARFLLECAARAAEISAPRVAAEATAAERLALAALVGLEGEVEVDDTLRARFEARRQALEGARQRGDYAAFAARGAQLERDVRSAALPNWLFARAYGDFDPRRGLDGLAKLSCDVHLARARLALAAKARDEAQSEVRDARASCGASEAARADVEQLEKEILAGRR